MGRLKSILIIALIFLGSACGPDATPLDFVPVINPTVGTIDTSQAPLEVIGYLQQAVIVWDSHGLHFDIANGGEIKAGEAPKGYLGTFYLRPDGSSYVFFSRQSYGYNMSCLAASYLALAIQLPYRTTHGLTGTDYLVAANQECPWTVEDEKKVCDYTGCDQ